MNDFLGNLSAREAKYLVFGMIAAFAGCFKLAAHLYRRTTLTWPNAFLVLAVVLVGQFVTPQMREAPLAVSMSIRLVVVVALGAVALKFRAKSADGQPLSNADALKISAMGYGLLSLVTAAIIGMLLAI